MHQDFYVYAHYRKSDGSIFYVGKRQNNRSGKTQHRNLYWRRVAEKHGWGHIKIKWFSSESEAFLFEKDAIRILKAIGAKITNLTAGGEGASGHIKSPETCSKISRNRKGKGLSENPKECPSTKEVFSTWWHSGGEIFRGSHADLHLSKGVNLKLAKAVEQGRKFSVSGWKKVGVRNYPIKPTADMGNYVFSHPTHPTFIGLRSDFCSAYDLCTAKVSRLVGGTKGKYKGWTCRAL
tara:strand:- start:509 stop:1216 length:708 start_codon:yes stop_codon:yes gene_type:complete